jgi:outer membrane protein assembly factor BamB
MCSSCQTRGLLVLISLCASIGAWGDKPELVKHLTEQSGTTHGICLTLGASDPRFIVALAENTSFLVYALEPDAAIVDKARSEAAGKGFGIDRVLVEQMPLGRLPCADGIVDLILAVDLTHEALDAISFDEIRRVLRPNGQAIIGVTKDAEVPEARTHEFKTWLKKHKEEAIEEIKNKYGLWGKVAKPAQEGMDDWSHWTHGPDNNPVSKDRVIRAPYRTQWLGLPYYVAMPAVTTASAGRVFVAMGHIAHHEREEPWLNTLLARNGYNGAELWRRRLPDGYMVHRSAFIATPDTFYMIDPDGAGCLMLDPETGREKGRVVVPGLQGEWKWMALRDGKLYVLAGRKEDPPETTVVRSQGAHWSWVELSRGYYTPEIPWGFGETLAAYDLARRRVLWMHKEDKPMDSRAMAVGGDCVFYYVPESHLGCVDAASGRAVWENSDFKLCALIEEPGKGLGSTPGFRTECFCLYTPKGLFYQAQTRMNVVAVSKDDGSVMWHRPKTTNNPNVIYLEDGTVESGNVLAGIGPNGSTLVVNPLTGETIRDLQFAKHSCARLTATNDSVFCRGWPDGLTRYDRQSGTVYQNSAARPACNDGAIGANGLLYLGPWLCDCNLSLMGTVALCSAGEFDPETPPAADRLQVFAKQPDQVAPLPLCDQDWPVYRGNNSHTGSSLAEPPSPIQPAWTIPPERTFTPTAPVAAGGLIFLAGSDGVVRAFDAGRGAAKWRFATSGPILQPPTIWEGRAYVGSGDGYVYALEAATGRPLWRFRAAPVERRIMVYGNLCSTWPVNSGVLIRDGVAYFAAGIIDYDGTYLYALDAKTGAVKWENRSTGHLDKAARKGVSAQGNMTFLGDKLLLAGGNVVSPAAFCLETGQYQGPFAPQEAPSVNRGEEIGLIADRFVVYGGRLRYSAIENVVDPGQFEIIETGRPAVVFSACKVAPAWDQEQLVFLMTKQSCPVSYRCDFLGKPGVAPEKLWAADSLAGAGVVALALTKSFVVAVYEARPDTYNTLYTRWNVVLLKRSDGTPVTQQNLPVPQWPEKYQGALLALFPLPAAAVPNGVAVDREGRVVVVLVDGTVTCFDRAPG